MRVRATAVALLGLWGCATTPLEQGERLYREGDRRGALEVWRAAPVDDDHYPEIARRIEEVESEFTGLVRGYKESAAALESEGRLAEALLDFRLALALDPDDAAGWAHVQQLARDLDSRETGLESEYHGLLLSGDLQAARASLIQLRALDPFEPQYEIEDRQLQAGLALQTQKQQQRARQKLSGEVAGLIEAGRAAFAQEHLETALVLWRQALLIDPQNERLQAYIARAEGDLDKLERLRDKPPEPTP